VAAGLRWLNWFDDDSFHCQFGMWSCWISLNISSTEYKRAGEKSSHRMDQTTFDRDQRRTVKKFRAGGRIDVIRVIAIKTL